MYNENVTYDNTSVNFGQIKNEIGYTVKKTKKQKTKKKNNNHHHPQKQTNKQKSLRVPYRNMNLTFIS